MTQSSHFLAANSPRATESVTASAEPLWSTCGATHLPRRLKLAGALVHPQGFLTLVRAAVILGKGRYHAAVAFEAVIYVQSFDSMIQFYERVVDLSIGEREEDFCRLSSPDVTLTLVRAPIDAAEVISHPPRRRSENPIKLSFEVSSVATSSALVQSNLGHLPPESSTWNFDGYERLDVLDPEGNVVQLRGLATPA